MSKFFPAARVLTLIAALLLMPQMTLAQSLEDILTEAEAAIEEERLDDAIDHLNRAIRIAEHPYAKLHVYDLYGYTFYLSGQQDMAIENYTKALEVAELLHHLELQKGLLQTLHSLANETGKLEQAASYKERLEAVEAEIMEELLSWLWVEDYTTGDLTYVKAGMVFPRTVGLFVRGEPNVYDGEGYDVSIGYTISDVTDKAVMTIYSSYYPDMDFEGYIAFSRRDLIARHQDAADIIDEKKIIHPAEGENEETGVYGLRLKVRNPELNDNWSDEELWIAGQGHWFVKIRVTRKEAYADQTIPSFLQFLDEVDIGLNDDFIAVLTAQSEAVDFCPADYSTWGSGQRPETENPLDILATVSLLLTADAISDEGNGAAPRCVVRAEGYDSGFKMALLANPEGPVALQTLSPVYVYRFYDPEWNVYRNIEISKMGGVYKMMAVDEDSTALPDELYLLTGKGDGGFSVFEYYDGMPSEETAYKDAIAVATGEKEMVFELLPTEGGGLTINLNSKLLGDEEGAEE